VEVEGDAVRAVCGAMTTLAATLGQCERHWLQFVKGFRQARHEPPPLCIDGHEYHRRQRRRTKRKGRR